MIWRISNVLLTGWPTDWDTKDYPDAPVDFATKANAASYNNIMINRINHGLSTPKMKNLATEAAHGYRMPIEVYIFEAFDEALKGGGNSPWEGTWGTMYENGTSKYDLNWAGDSSPSSLTTTLPEGARAISKWAINSAARPVRFKYPNFKAAHVCVYLVLLLCSLCTYVLPPAPSTRD